MDVVDMMDMMDVVEEADGWAEVIRLRQGYGGQAGG
jgi:hypothetical protein